MRDQVVPEDKESVRDARYSASFSLGKLHQRSSRLHLVDKGGSYALVFADGAFLLCVIFLVKLVDISLSFCDRFGAFSLRLFVALRNLLCLMFPPLAKRT